MSAAIDKLLFAAASGLADVEERRVFLDHACRDDPDMRKLLDGMLEVQAEAEDFFTFPPQEAGESPRREEEELGTLIGRYRLIERIGEGGCGVVYLAEQQEPVWRKVALKIIRLGMDTESVIARFEVERQALALMDHPNIARVLDAGATASGRPYFVMELADGEKITDFCDRKGLGLRQRLELFLLVCEAIQHAHQKGVIHRDIKPSNVLVREHDGQLVPKVIDFGIAKVTAGVLDAEGTATKHGQLIGTPAYMSPEQAEGGVDIDTRSDIYSLGVLLFELLTGGTPLKFEQFSGRGVEEIRGILREGRIHVPSMRLREISREEIGGIADRRGADPQRLASLIEGDLDWIVMKAIEKERQRRYETANGLAMDVQRYLQDEPVLARPPSRWYLLTKLVRRNRGAFAAAGIALFGLLAGLGFATWLFLRERDAREEQARLRVMAEQATANERRLREDAEAVDLVRQAAWLLRYREIEQADKLLGGLPVERMPRSFETAEALKKVANWNLTQGRWNVAANRFHSLGRVLTSVDRFDWGGISFDYLSVATAVCVWGGPGQYEELRELAIGRFAGSANATVAEQAIKAMLLKPADPATLEKLVPLGNVLEASLSGPRTATPHLTAWRKFSLALMAYRQGDLEAADGWARRSLAMSSDSDYRGASNQLILAMIAIGQGRAAEASTMLKDLRGEVDEWTGGSSRIVNPEAGLWHNPWIVGILLREAEGMLDGKSE